MNSQQCLQTIKAVYITLFFGSVYIKQKEARSRTHRHANERMGPLGPPFLYLFAVGCGTIEAIF